MAATSVRLRRERRLFEAAVASSSPSTPCAMALPIVAPSSAPSPGPHPTPKIEAGASRRWSLAAQVVHRHRVDEARSKALPVRAPILRRSAHARAAAALAVDQAHAVVRGTVTSRRGKTIVASARHGGRVGREGMERSPERRSG